MNRIELINSIREQHNIEPKDQVDVKNLNAEFKTVSEDGTFEAIITTDSLDLQNEVLLPAGLDASYFMKAGTIYWNHDYTKPLAKPLSIKATDDGKGWLGIAQFAKRPEGAEGDQWNELEFIQSLMQQGIIKGVSVGLKPKETRQPTPKDEDMFGEVKNVISKWMLLEWSVTPIPANPDALIQQVNKGLISADQCKRVGIDMDALQASATTTPVEDAQIDSGESNIEEPTPEPKKKKVVVLHEKPKPKRTIILHRIAPEKKVKKNRRKELISDIVRTQVARALGILYL